MFLGLPIRFIIRHWILGSIIAALSVNLVTEDPQKIDALLIWIAAMNTLVYPYARFLYFWLVKTVIGEHKVCMPEKWLVFRVLYVVTVAVMLWSVSVLVAPVGMLVLYFVRRNLKGQGNQC